MNNYYSPGKKQTKTYSVPVKFVQSKVTLISQKLSPQKYRPITQIDKNMHMQYNSQNINQTPISNTIQKSHIYPNSDQYIGQWSSQFNTPQGYGCYKFKNQSLQYRGNFQSGQFHLQGTLYRLVARSKPQIIYQGQWINGQKSGKGKYFYDTQTYYQGSWLNNRKQGAGTFISPHGTYIGEWFNDLKNGKGLMKLTNGNVIQGLWQKDQLVQGRIIYANGDIYDGRFNNWKRHQQGQYTFANQQQQYKGNWINNEKDGHAQIIYRSGEKFQGDFSNGVIIGNSKYIWENGVQILGQFQNNFPVRGKLIEANKKQYQFQIVSKAPQSSRKFQRTTIY